MSHVLSKQCRRQLDLFFGYEPDERPWVIKVRKMINELYLQGTTTEELMLKVIQTAPPQLALVALEMFLELDECVNYVDELRSVVATQN